MKKATKKEVLELATKMTEKYCDLVWYARKTDNDYKTIPAVKEHMDRIDQQYSEEIDQLCGENGDWAHGFNSGCLAAFRLIAGMMADGIEESLEYFPDLDS